MNWLSAFDILPLVVIVLCAVDHLRKVVAHKQPISTLLLIFIAISGFHWIAAKVHGQDTRWWELALDALIAVIFGYQTLTADKESTNVHADHSGEPV